MKVTTKDVEYIAQLSRLTIPEGEMEKFTEQFNQILNYADILQKLDTAGIEPTPYVLPLPFQKFFLLRLRVQEVYFLRKGYEQPHFSDVP